FFFLFRDRTGRTLYESRMDRLDGNYPRYHGREDADAELTGYIFTHLANGEPDNPRYRLRDVPPFDPVIAESRGKGGARQGVRYKVTILKQGERIRYLVNGETILDHMDTGKNPLHASGLIGFRTFQSHISWDNLLVTALDPDSPSD
ncbi:MAG: DUF1961 family protein, partial [Puniceicoccaceae bacterium]